MFTLRSILETYRSVLVLDAASAHVHAGWILSDSSSRWSKIEAEASSGVFAAIQELSVDPAEVGAFVFCEGPGSILGIRTVATAIRTWVAMSPRPVFSFRSLELVARTAGRPGQTVICDARRQSWHATAIGHELTLGPLRRIPTAELPPVGLITPAGFRRWSAPPTAVPLAVPYEPARLANALAEIALLREAPEPDAFLHEDPAYAPWTPAVHRAPEKSA